jgi:hypothetical protein
MDLVLDFFTGCGFKRLYELGIYFGVALALMTAFSYLLLGIAALHQGFLKTLVGLAFYVLTIAAMLFLLYAMDEGLLLKRHCSIARVDAASFILWAIALLAGFSINQLIFGKRLRESGYHKRLYDR